MMLEALAFTLDTNDVVNSLETMERNIKEFERHANINFPEFLKVGIANRQTEDGPTRTHLIMNARRSRHQSRSDDCQTSAKCGDGKDGKRNGCRLVLEGTALWSFQRFWKPAGVAKGTASVRAPQETERWWQRKVEGCKERRWQRCRERQERIRRQVLQCGKSGHMSKDCRSKESNAFEVGEEEPLSENGCFDMASIELNALEIESVQVPEEIRQIRIGIDSCAAVTVFPKRAAEDYSVLRTPGTAQSYRPASGKLLPDPGARKVQVKLRDSLFDASTREWRIRTEL